MEAWPIDCVVSRLSAGEMGGVDCAMGASSAGLASPPHRKRARLSAADEALLENLTGPRRRILEHKLVRLKHLKERYVEHSAELLFLQAGGSLLDYAAWRKRPPAPQLLNFLHTNPLHTDDDAEDLHAVLMHTQSSAPPAPPTTTLVRVAASPATDHLQTTPPSTPAASQDQLVEKAKQEAYVVRRATELQREGLWAEKRLPRVLEPSRAKAHWDYLLEEMAWLAADFAHERKWKKAAAKKCARMVQKYFQDKASAVQRAEKAQELQLRRVAAFAAREVKTFWSNVEKLVEFKRSSRLEERRKRALDLQLSFIVGQTEKYSKQLAAGLADSHASRDDDFRPPASDSDDEETIAAAEREAHASRHDTRAEIDALERESRLDLDQVVKSLPAGYLEGAPPPSPPSSDYSADEDSEDDEDTIREQEKREDPRDTSQEIDQLKAENELSIEELMKKYSGAPSPPTTPSVPAESDSESQSNESDKTSSYSSVSSESDAEETLGALVEEQRVERASELAAALQPTGYTLSETAVATPVPHLLKHELREYQHVGLHWLATMRARRLNGILADEMGLGKTIQTIALLAHEALERLDWGPHLVVVPTSVMLNWEMEFKKWCPALKILTYYGTIKERKLKRVGWTKPNAFHVCITSYKLVIQDHQSFRRKRWKYLILDEAQNIKNFKSQRWQLLLNFQTEQRLLLTGTPLQNNLMELWSLMHFLMPDVFASHTEFKEWFSPVAGMIEGTASFNQTIIQRLHKVLRPFLLRRLKSEVEKQMPKKYEHVLMCRLSKRQRFLYDDFMSRAKTRESLSSGNLLSVINVLMQLRKVCNHPNLLETRPVVSPLQLAALLLRAPALLLLTQPDRRDLGGDLATLELRGVDAVAAHRARHLAPPRRLVEELVGAEHAPAPPPPAGAVRLHVRLLPRPAPRAPPPDRALASRVLRRPPPGAPPPPVAPRRRQSNTQTTLEERLAARRRENVRRLGSNNEWRCWRLPLLGADLRAAVAVAPPQTLVHRAPAPADRLRHMHHTVDRFTVYIAAAAAPTPLMVVGRGAAERRSQQERRDADLARALRTTAWLLHPVASRLATAFPHPRLIQYDCGKLQTLDLLLRRLRSGGHRVLIFTQMTRMLDVLEAFLNHHGHTYLRLDGSTRVEHRQQLVERFNGDRRVFAFILSTRSGGVGLNLTGADTVVFYDSDWNPTMDAQAQDRCHRIGQTRDVHVYRLVSERTVEENILRKAGQKRQLGDVAIESGNFTTAHLRNAALRELVAGASGAAAGADGGAELESALAACEDEADAAAARTAGAEAAADLAEFDETIPLEEDAHADREIKQLEEQLTPIEKYAMRVVESSEAASEAERAAAREMERQLQEWENSRRAIRSPPSPPATSPEPSDCDVSFPAADARNHVWISYKTTHRMPMWCPPTPPQGAGDVYVDACVDALYRRGAMAEAQLPARRSPRPARDPRRASLLHVQPASHAPRSLFERPQQAARPRARARPAPPEAERAPDWAAAEDAALAAALRAQGLSADPPAPALAPNWDLAADAVAEVSRAHRSARQCRDRHDDDERRKQKKARRSPPPQRAARRADDELWRAVVARFDAMRLALERKGSAPKRRYDEPANNPRHAAALADHGVEYDAPLTPMEIAARRVERLTKEKAKAPAAAPRIVVAAAHPVSTLLAKPGGVGAVTGVSQAQLHVLRHQAYQRKLLQTSSQQGAGGGASSGGGALATPGRSPRDSGAGGSTPPQVKMASATQIRQLQLQQQMLAQRKVAAAAAAARGARVLPRPPAPVVVAHLAPQDRHPPHTQPNQ